MGLKYALARKEARPGAGSNCTMWPGFSTNSTVKGEEKDRVRCPTISPTQSELRGNLPEPCTRFVVKNGSSQAGWQCLLKERCILSLYNSFCTGLLCSEATSGRHQPDPTVGGACTADALLSHLADKKSGIQKGN